MKKLSIVIAVPLLVIAVVVAVAFYLKVASTVPSPSEAVTPNRQIAPLSGDLSKPAAGGSLSKSGTVSSGTSTPTPKVTTTQSSVSDMNKELQSTSDDGGASDLNSLKKDASGL